MIFYLENEIVFNKLTELLVSVKLLKSGVIAARPLFPRPFGVRESRSSVGESQNLKKTINQKLFMIYVYKNNHQFNLIT